MERVGVLVVSYGARGAAIVDAVCRSEKYFVEVYVADRQKNPFNVKRSRVHVVIPDLNVDDICKFAKKHEDRIDFGVVGPEKPIINGVRDIIENEANIPLICPAKEYAIEKSKVAQRLLFQEAVPEVNPKFKVFDPKDYRGIADVKRDVWEWLDELNNQVAVKPDNPVFGKGVGVWGDHFNTRKQLFDHFLANYERGSVIIEEKVDGEESSFQAFCDGKHLVPLPETRDYKRAFDGDAGPNTGGMGSYKDVVDWLPFMTAEDREEEIKIVEKVFRKLKGMGSNPGLRGMPFYCAFVHTEKGLKIFENNSRPGDPEIQNLLPIMKDDFVDVCFKIIDGNLRDVKFEDKASVVIYKAPPSYGGYVKAFPERVKLNEVNKPVDLSKTHKLIEKFGNGIRIFPASMELRNGETYALGSRAISVVGVGGDIQTAREISLEGVKAIMGGSLWHRSDIGSEEHIRKSIDHIKKLRFRR